MSGGLIGTGNSIDNSAMKGLLSSAEMENQRNIANDNIRAQKEAAAKSRNGTVAGIGAYMAPSAASAIGGMMAPAAGPGMAGMVAEGADATIAAAGTDLTALAADETGVLVAEEVGTNLAAEGLTDAALTMAPEVVGDVAAEAGAASLMGPVGWVAAAGLGVYALGSMFDWW